MKLNCIITEWIENRRFAFTAKSKEVKAEGCYRIEPTEGGCSVMFEENLELRALYCYVTKSFHAHKQID